MMQLTTPSDMGKQAYFQTQLGVESNLVISLEL